MNLIKNSLGILALTATMFVSCDKNNDPTPVPSTTVTNLDADAGTGRTAQGQPIGTTGHFTFFNFKSGTTVSHTDSATTKWDVAFRGTTIIVNNTTSGPGTAQAFVYSGLFDELNEAPETGYRTDNKAATNASDKYAIPTGSGNGWYTYDAANFVIKPTPGKVIVVKTAEGRYAKIEILSYYKNAPSSPNYMTDIDRYYTFRYVYQAADTRSFLN